MLRWLRTPPATLALLAALACSGGPTASNVGAPDAAVRTDATDGVDATAAEDATSGTDADAALTPDASEADGGEASEDAGAEDPWAPVRAALDEEVASGALVGFSLTVRAGAPNAVFEHAGGAYRLEQLIPTDSSIKPVTGLLATTLIRDGILGLADTMGDRLGWSGPEAAVTVGQLMSFTSGFDGSASCLSPPPALVNGRLIEPGNTVSLTQCAETIRAGGLISAPGTALQYGGSHQAVLATVVESTTGATWASLFAARILEPLGLSETQLRYVNNRVAGSAVATSDAMARVLEALAMDLGLVPRRPETVRILPEELARRFVSDQTADPVDRTDSPWRLVAGVDLHFGLGIWLDCTDFSRAPEGCLYVGSGANGSTAWIDADGAYVAALGLYQGSFLGFRDGYRVMQRLAPLVRAALRDGP